MTKNRREGIERRLFPRIKAEVYYRAPRVAPKKRAIHDISLGGVRINCDEKLKVGRELEMEFYMPDGNAIAAIAKVRWTAKRAKGSDTIYTAGLEFMHLTPKAAEQLRKVCVANSVHVGDSQWQGALEWPPSSASVLVGGSRHDFHPGWRVPNQGKYCTCTPCSGGRWPWKR